MPNRAKKTIVVKNPIPGEILHTIQNLSIENALSAAKITLQALRAGCSVEQIKEYIESKYEKHEGSWTN